MESEKLQVVLGENVTKAELIIREGGAVKELDPKAPIKTDIRVFEKACWYWSIRARAFTHLD